MKAGILIALLLAGGGTSYAAQNAVPGDVLYPVKVGVNENVRTALAFSSRDKAAVETELITERLEEAQRLAAEGKLDAKAEAEIQARVAAHYQEALKNDERVYAEGDLSASASLRSSLEGTFRTYADVLGSARGVRTGLVGDLTAYADAVSKTQATATAAVSAEVGADVEATLKRAQESVDTAATALDRAHATLSASAYAQINARLKSAQQATADAATAFAADDYQKAYADAQLAMNLSVSITALINSEAVSKSSPEVNLESTIDSILQVRDGSSTVGSTTDIDDRIEAHGSKDAEIREDVQSRTDSNAAINADAGSVDIDIDTHTDATTNTNIDLGL
jgi:hypothetical protein